MKWELGGLRDVSGLWLTYLRFAGNGNMKDGIETGGYAGEISRLGSGLFLQVVSKECRNGQRHNNHNMISGNL